MLRKLFVGNVAPAFRILVILVVCILGTGKTYAQVAEATLTGTVKDSSGGVIPNARVAISASRAELSSVKVYEVQ
jgi:hypothetical protein